jgi:leader peptidase (prepilin peptidase)/N-methyltransferase
MTGFVVVAAVVLGLVLGSFGGVVADRVPRHESVVRPASHCVACGARLRAAENVPLLSYLVLRGRCRRCGTRIPLRDLLVEVGTAALFGALAWRVRPHALLPADLVGALALVVLSAIDLRHRLIPRVVLYPSVLACAGLLAVASAVEGDFGALAHAAVAGAVSFGAFFALYAAVPKGIGFGDVRLAGFCGLLLGWQGYRVAFGGVVAGIVLGGVAALGLLLTGRAGRKTAIPFGPFLAAGTVLGMLAGGVLERLVGG